eukprot:5718439-Pyramimonas_sp.AAC.1
MVGYCATAAHVFSSPPLKCVRVCVRVRVRVPLIQPPTAHFRSACHVARLQDLDHVEESLLAATLDLIHQAQRRVHRALFAALAPLNNT